SASRMWLTPPPATRRGPWPKGWIDARRNSKIVLGGGTPESLRPADANHSEPTGLPFLGGTPMSLKCFFGWHSWLGCRCVSCPATRDIGHSWDYDCTKCARCEKRRDLQHD